MTTTLCANGNAQPLQVSTTVEENARDASAWSSRAGSSPPTIASVVPRRFNPLSRRAGSIAPPYSAHRGGLELSTGTGPYGACRSTQCCLAVWSRWVESSTRLRGFSVRALAKKTPEARALHYQSELSQANQLWILGTTMCTVYLRLPHLSALP
jgi:hypothetical protein